MLIQYGILLRSAKKINRINMQRNLSIKKVRSKDQFSQQKLICEHIYQQLSQPINKYVIDAKLNLQKMGVTKSKQLINNVIKKLDVFIKNKSQTGNLLKKNFSDRNIQIKEKKQRRIPKIFDQNKLEKEVRNYYHRGNISLRNHQDCLIINLIKNSKINLYHLKTSNKQIRIPNKENYKGNSIKHKLSNKWF